MPVTPTGIFSEHLSLMRDLIAAPAAFQTWVGAASAAAAKAFIHIQAVNVADIVRPFVTIGYGPGTIFIPQSMGPYGQHNIDVFFYSAAVTAGLSHEDAIYTFTNSLGPIIEGICNLAGTPGYLVVNQLEFVQVAPRSFQAETVDYFRAHWVARTGARP